jgi:hypothetical protein
VKGAERRTSEWFHAGEHGGGGGGGGGGHAVGKEDSRKVRKASRAKYWIEGKGGDLNQASLAASLEERDFPPGVWIRPTRVAT